MVFGFKGDRVLHVQSLNPAARHLLFEGAQIGDLFVCLSGHWDHGSISHWKCSLHGTDANTTRIRPTNAVSAWQIADTTPKSIKLDPQYCKTSTTTPQDFRFDEILTGSENKPVYNAVARSHVCAAMDGFNAVIFAYGQTASGKTFTLVSLRQRSALHAQI